MVLHFPIVAHQRAAALRRRGVWRIVNHQASAATRMTALQTANIVSVTLTERTSSKTENSNLAGVGGGGSVWPYLTRNPSIPRRER